MLAVGGATVVEWYDFTLCLYFAPTLSRVFFGTGKDALGDTLAGFAIAYLMRPLGALLLGLLGDRRGRRPTLLLTMAAMTMAMLGIALLPTHQMVGLWAGWALVLMRCLMGFSVGGEYTAVVTYLYESAPAHRRGLITSLAAAASEIGGLLAVGLCALLTGSLDAASLEGWGWRVPFLFGAALAGTIWVLRGTISETPEFHQPAADQPSPLAHVLRHERKGIAAGFAISALGSISYYVGITYVPTYLALVGGTDQGLALEFSTLAALVVIAVTPVVGWLSDIAGRKAVLLTLCAACALLPMALFKLIAGGSTGPALGAIALLAALAGGVSAVGTVATVEQFSALSRLSGLALGATSATALFGGLTPFLAHRLQQATGLIEVPGIMIALVALGSGLALMRLLPGGKLRG
ncbi:MAG: MFS transporter [Sphingomonadales bacterium]|nr:MFS transporter [Sphingomonadales bacterium]MDE2170126.1 MFS transporter [Sphingomonadales bacterium]